MVGNDFNTEDSFFIVVIVINCNCNFNTKDCFNNFGLNLLGEINRSTIKDKEINENVKK